MIPHGQGSIFGYFLMIQKIGVNPSESNYEIKGIVLANSAALKPPKIMKKSTSKSMHLSDSSSKLTFFLPMKCI